MKILKQEGAVISEKPIWIAFHGPYMYDSESLLGLFWTMLREWNNDKHLVG